MKPTFGEYAAALKDAVPSLFAPEAPVRMITEFGRCIVAKAGAFVSKVEYTKVNGGRFILQQHCGHDLLTRTVWAPAEWKLRVEVFDGTTGEPRDGELIPTDVAGPCCLGADMAAVNVPLPKATQPNDLVVIKDVGGYYHASYNYYNLREAPACFLLEGTSLRCIRRAATTEETIAFTLNNAEA